MSRFGRQPEPFAVAVVAILVALVAWAPSVRPTAAGFTDSAGVRSSTLAAAQLTPPANLTCTNGPSLLGYVDLAWTPGTGTGHHVEVESTPGTWITMGTTGPGTGTLRVTSTTMGSVLSLGVAYRVRVSATAGQRWASAPTSTVSVKTLSVLGIGLTVVCA